MHSYFIKSVPHCGVQTVSKKVWWNPSTLLVWNWWMVEGGGHSTKAITGLLVACMHTYFSCHHIQSIKSWIITSMVAFPGQSTRGLSYQSSNLLSWLLIILMWRAVLYCLYKRYSPHCLFRSLASYLMSMSLYSLVCAYFCLDCLRSMYGNFNAERILTCLLFIRIHCLRFCRSVNCDF